MRSCFKTHTLSNARMMNYCEALVIFVNKCSVCFQGVVTAATSLITTLAQKNPDDFKTSVSLAVARLSRVGVFM